MVEREGLRNTTLRPLAAELGVSPRTLLYQFGSKAQLMAAVVQRLRSRYPALGGLRREHFGPPEPAPSAGIPWREQPHQVQERLATVVQRLWCEAKQPDMRPFFALYFELAALAIRDPESYRAAFCGIEQEWNDLITGELAAHGIDAETALLVANVVVTGYRGALQHALATGDWQQSDGVVRTLITTAAQLLR